MSIHVMTNMMAIHSGAKKKAHWKVCAVGDIQQSQFASSYRLSTSAVVAVAIPNKSAKACMYFSMMTISRH